MYAVDACCSNIPVIQALDGNSFNLSPLRGYKEAMFVVTAEELSAAIMALLNRSKTECGHYFYLEQNLSRWQAIINKELL
jgi:surface carbohydrate biosynthesis protein (TIGR04326 family)